MSQMQNRIFYLCANFANNKTLKHIIQYEKTITAAINFQYFFVCSGTEHTQAGFAGWEYSDFSESLR